MRKPLLVPLPLPDEHVDLLIENEPRIVRKVAGTDGGVLGVLVVDTGQVLAFDARTARTGLLALGVPPETATAIGTRLKRGAKTYAAAIEPLVGGAIVTFGEFAPVAAKGRGGAVARFQASLP